MGINPKDTSVELTINISADSVMGMVVANWESHARMKPSIGGGVPTTITQLSKDPNVSGLNAGGIPTSGQPTTNPPGGGICAPNLVYPDVTPPYASTHLHGRYHLTQFGNLKWMEYDQPLLQSQLPVNTKWSDDHWIDQLQPDGLIYIGCNPEGMRMYLQPGNPGHWEQVAQINSVSNAPVTAGLHPGKGQGITTHTAQTIQPNPTQVSFPVTGNNATNSTPVVATVPVVVNPVGHHSPQANAGTTPPVTNPVAYQSPTVTTVATQVKTPTTNNTAANQTPVANSSPIPLNFTTRNQVQARPQQRTTFAPLNMTGAHQPTPNPVITPGRYAPHTDTVEVVTGDSHMAAVAAGIMVLLEAVVPHQEVTVVAFQGGMEWEVMAVDPHLEDQVEPAVVDSHSEDREELVVVDHHLEDVFQVGPLEMDPEVEDSLVGLVAVAVVDHPQQEEHTLHLRLARTTTPSPANQTSRHTQTT